MDKFITRQEAAKVYGGLRGGNGNINTFVTALANRDDELLETTKEKPEQGDYYKDHRNQYWYKESSVIAFARKK